MCELCKNALCPTDCPNYREKVEVLPTRCRSCGDRLDATVGYLLKDGFPYCSTCILSALAEDLFRICELSTEEALGRLGFENIRA